jgi:hypothetical protein
LVLTSPSAKLDVNGDISITVPNANTSLLLKRDVSGTVYTYGSLNNAGSDFNINGTGNVFINADSDSDSTSTDRNVTFGNRGVEYMRVRYDGNVGIGNVGIGTTSPSTALDVVGTITAYRYQAISSSASLVGYGVGTGLGMFNAGTDTLGFATASTEKMRITSAGNVGIGTTSPAEKLHVVGIGRFDGVNVNVRAIDGTIITKIQSQTVGGTQGAVGTESNNDLAVVTNNTTRMLVTAAGNVGIGTTSPAAKLDIAYTTNPTTVTPHIILTTGGTVKQAAITAESSAVGGLVFSTGDGTLVDRMTILRSNGNVGIGTTSPGSYKLNVSGTGYYSGQLTVDGFTNNSGISFRDGFDPTNVGIRAKAVGTANRDGLELLGANGIDFTVNNGANVAMRIVGLSGSGMGNVGIGTTSPAYLLDVSGTARILNGIYFNNASGSFLWETGANALRFGTNNTERMRIDASGNVGIGTTSPDVKFQVQGGAVKATTSNYAAPSTGGAISMFQDSNDYGTIWAVKDYNGGWADVAISPLGGNVGIGTTSPLTKLEVVGDAYIYDSSVTASGLRIDTGTANLVKLRVGYPGAWANADVQIQSSTASGLDIGIYLKAGGNVGIGTTAPAGKLSVEGDGTEYSNIVFKQSSAQEHLIYASTNFQYNLIGSGTPTWIWGQQGASERMRLNNTGLGIGTTSPAQKLDVVGKMKISDDIILAQTNGRIDYDNGVSTGALRFFSTSGSAERMRITSAGNVGIGTTAPTAKLDVAGAGLSTDFRVSRSVDPTAYFSINAPGGGPNASTFGVNGVDVMTLRVDGNVGIGTTIPSFPLTIYGNSFAASVYQTSATGTGVSNGFYVGHSNSISYVWNYNNFPIVLATNNTEKLRITASGNVGIGTTSPTTYDAAKIGSSHRFLNVQSGANLYSVFTLAGNQSNDGDRIGYITFVNDANSSSYKYTAWIGSEVEGATAGQRGSRLIFSTMGNGSAAGPIERMRITAAGNVGIGTTSPVSKLDVAGAGYFSGESLSAGLDQTYTNVGLLIDEGDYIYTKDSSTTLRILMGKVADIIKIGQNGTSLIDAIELIPGTTGGRVSIFDNTTETVRFQNGNVGIGTTNPTVPLQIVKDNATISMTNTTAFAVDTGSRLFLGGKYDTAGTTSPFAWIVGAKENATDGNQAGYLSITTVENGGGFAERMRVTSTGNVGIGTTSPSDTLDLYQAANTTAIRLTSAGVGSKIYRLTSQLIGVSNAGFGIQNATDGRYELAIDGSGNVGIGNTNPTAKLQVGPEAHPSATGIEVAAGAGGANLLALDSSTNHNWLPFTDGSNYYSAVSHTFRNELHSTDWMKITSAGNVGIGTTAPGTKLDVVGNARMGANTSQQAFAALQVSAGEGTVTTYRDIDLHGAWAAGEGHAITANHSSGVSDIVGQIVFQHDSPGSKIKFGRLFHSGNQSTYPMELVSDGASANLTITGKVGIGTTSPTNPLTVTTATNAVDVLRLNNTGGDSGAVQGVTHLAINHFNGGTNPSTRITAYQDSTSGWPGGMYFSTRSLNTDSAPLERMRITSAGNIGIGTTSPQYLLDVNGDAQINAQGTGPAYAYVPDGGFGVDNLITSGSENVALGKPDVWLRIHVDGVAFVFPGYQEP